MGKAPAFQFYPMDWCRDTATLSLAAKGAWMDILCALWWSETRGKMTASPDDWARTLREVIHNTMTVIGELKSKKIADFIVHPNGDITVISRRMVRDEIERQNSARRQRERYTRITRPHADLTPLSRQPHVPSSSSSSFIAKAIRPETTPAEPGKPDQERDPKRTRPLTANQVAVLMFKKRGGVPENDKGWDKVYFPRFSAPAKQLLILFENDLVKVERCIDGVATWLEERNLSWTPETIVAHAGQWKAGKVKGPVEAAADPRDRWRASGLSLCHGSEISLVNEARICSSCGVGQ